MSLEREDKGVGAVGFKRRRRRKRRRKRNERRKHSGIRISV
jgi:hypothetical protein